MNDPRAIPENESPVRRMMADVHGTPHHPLRSLEDAQQYEDGVVILEGDWGGQVYAVIPANMIRCSTDILQRLLLAFDTQAWSCNENEGCSIFYERKPIGTEVAGGVRGGASTGDLWVHPEFNTIAHQIRRVIFAEQECIDVS